MEEVKGRARGKVVRTAPQLGEVMMDEMVVLPYCSDSGSDSTVIPMQGVEVQPIPIPIDAEVTGRSTVICFDSVALDTVLQTATGTDISKSETDFLLTNDTLVSLGIDVNHQMEQLVGGALDTQRVSTRLKRKNVPMPACPPWKFVISLKTLCLTLYSAMEYEELFRVDLGADPPADIATLRNKLVDSAKPFRARSCWYAPAQRNFLREYAKRLELVRITEVIGQLPLHPDSQELMSFITTDTVWTPTRVPQRANDSATYFPNEMKHVFADTLYFYLIMWMDDIFLYAMDDPSFIAALRSGICDDPGRTKALQALPLPTTAADLQQFLYAAGWMRDTLVDFARVMCPLCGKLEAILSVSGRTKKLAAGAVLTRMPEEEDMFKAAKQLLGSSQPLRFPKASTIISVFTDAMATWDPEKLAFKQHHEPLRHLDATKHRWSIIAKEPYPIILPSGLHVILVIFSFGPQGSDFVNFFYVFSPTHEVKRHIRGKLQRWALSSTGFPYRIDHIDGKTNVWADLLSRWGSTSPEEPATLQDAASRQLDELRPLQGDFVFPTLDEMKQLQQKRTNSTY
ncbi:hypothetical protein PHPALM_30524 [Phytophthora palmivora]|uniref:Reverse transcriptase n=1 Tax=Phytophthora palmivora TaxID=4796 RepID=A0A2P4X4X7_9STRA|nr:hypothetical protein PHPALM_30524 [Phytophthora palmivora]